MPWAYRDNSRWFGFRYTRREYGLVPVPWTLWLSCSTLQPTSVMVIHLGLMPDRTLLDGQSRPCSQVDLQYTQCVPTRRSTSFSYHRGCSLLQLNPESKIGLLLCPPKCKHRDFKSSQWCMRVLILQSPRLRRVWILFMMYKISGWGLQICYRQESQRLEARPLKVDVRREELQRSSSERSRNQRIDSKRSLGLLLHTPGFFYTN
jgi:hypothetical protein